MKPKGWLIAGAAALLLVAPFSICSMQIDDEESDQPLEANEPEPVEELLPILSTAKEYGSLGTLVKLLKESGLDAELKDTGPYTLFAPDDSAFLSLAKGKLDQLRSDPEALKAVLSRHIVKGRALIIGDEADETVKSLGGDKIRISADEESAYVEYALIMDEGIECSNGVIHVIDAVLLPGDR